MKRTLLITLYLLSVISMMAGPVGKNRATQLASQYLTTPQIVVNQELRSAEAPAYYIFNEQNQPGYVIIAGDDLMTEIIGYSDCGTIEPNNMPDALNYLLDCYAKRVHEVRQGLRAAHKVNARYPEVKVSPLVSSRYDQLAPYNWLCPNDQQSGKSYTLSGCVAVSMTQVMYTNKWPEHGKGYISYMPFGFYNKLSKDLSQSTYKWDKMRDTYVSGQYSQEEGNAVAEIMYDAGLAAYMNYDYQASSTAPEKAAYALDHNFNYNVKFMERDHFSTDYIESCMKQELESGYPFIFGGSGDGGGHSFICDGYNSDNYFHINWGWSGDSDGYYAIDFMNPSSLGAGGGNGGFNEVQSAIFARPKNNKDQLPDYYQPTLSFISKTKNRDFGSMFLTFSSPTPDNVVLQFDGVAHGGYEPLVAAVGVQVLNKKGEVMMTKASNYTGESGIAFPIRESVEAGLIEVALDLSQLDDGEYTLLSVARPNGFDQWVPFSNAVSIKVRIKGDLLFILSDDNNKQFALNKAIVNEVPPFVKGFGRLSVDISNKSGSPFFGALLLEFVNVNNPSIKGSYHTEPFTLSPHESFVGEVTYNLNEMPKNVSHSADAHLRGEIKRIPAGKYKVTPKLELINIYHQYTEQFWELKSRFDDLIIEVKEVPNYGYVQYDGELDIYDKKFNLVKTNALDPNNSGQLYIAARFYNSNMGHVFTGKIVYSLRDIETQERIEIGSISKTIIDGSFVSPRKSRVAFVSSQLGLKKGHTYRVDIEAVSDEGTNDAWSPQHPRQYFRVGEMGTAIEAISTTSSLIVYPNPASEQLNVQSADLIRGYMLYGANGRLVMQSTLTPSEQCQLEVTSLKAGWYILSIETAQGTEHRKVQIRR